MPYLDNDEDDEDGVELMLIIIVNISIYNNGSKYQMERACT